MSRITLDAVSKNFQGARASNLREARARDGFGRSDGGSLEEDVRDSKLTESGGVRALDHVSLDIADGETVSVIGPSGCGKSTLLRVISGLETADSGSIHYDERDMTGVAPGERGIGMVFQNYALYPHMKAKNNLAFFFRMQKREMEIDDRVRITSEIMGVGFDQLLDRKPKTLSGGQQQRVAIARCIVRDPKVFLFDEPLSNLDAKLRSRTRIEIKRLLRRFNITAVYVTHDQIEAIALADRIAVMRQGRIEQIGPYLELHDRPVNAFVAGFVGTPPANFVRGTVQGNAIVVAGGSMAIPRQWRSFVETGGDVLVGLRPEYLTMAAPGATGDLRGVVDVVEPMVAERAQLVHVILNGDIANEVAVQIDAEIPVSRGQPIEMNVDPERTLLFDAKTERNLRV